MQPKGIVLTLLIFVFLLQACNRKTIATTSGPKTIAIEEIDFEFLHGKAKLNFKDGKKEKEATATIRIHKDSVIWMTLSLFGISGGKALINKDSVTIMNYIDKEYYVYDYTELSRRFNFAINYNVIQSAMLGNLILPMTPQDVIEEKPGYNELDQQQNTVAVKNFINSTTRKLDKLDLTESVSKNALNVDYSNFQPLGGKSFPYTEIVNLFYRTPSGIINNTITFEYTKVEVGTRELSFPFKIPKRYERR